MQQLITLFNGNRPLAPLNALFPANAVFDLDATIATSYNGGQLWKNIIASPADGAEKTAYNFNLGADNTANSDDPTFTGSVGSPRAYFSFDGGDYFSLAGTITNFLNNLHKGTSHTLIMCLSNQFNLGNDQGLFATADTYNSFTGLSYSVGWSTFFYRQKVSPTLVLAQRSGLSGATLDRLIVLSYNAATNTITSWVNTTTGTSTSWIFTATTLDQTGVKPSIGAVGTGIKLPNGSKIYSCAMLNSVVTDADVAKIIKFYNARHGRVYA